MSFRAHIVLTRPRHQSERFANLCREQLGEAIKITISPLLEIKDLAPEIDAARYQGFLFTSENAASAAARLWPELRPRAFTVGERTARAARKLGYDAAPCGGTVEAMIRHLSDLAPPTPLLHLRGRHSRGELAQNLGRAGLRTDQAVIYEQNAKQLSGMVKNLLCGDMPVLVPLFSPRTATIFFDECADITPNIEVIAMSEAVAERCVIAEKRIHIAPRPQAGAMIDCIGTVLSDL